MYIYIFKIATTMATATANIVKIKVMECDKSALSCTNICADTITNTHILITFFHLIKIFCVGQKYLWFMSFNAIYNQVEGSDRTTNRECIFPHVRMRLCSDVVR